MILDIFGDPGGRWRSGVGGEGGERMNVIRIKLVGHGTFYSNVFLQL